MEDTTARLRAVIDRIVPADEFPSASENGVLAFIERLLDRELAHEKAAILDGLRSLDAGFVGLDDATQDAILTRIEHQHWFQVLMRITQEGYYADRSNGANLEHASWRMIGYEPRRAIP